jgi:hypothetical protein
LQSIFFTDEEINNQEAIEDILHKECDSNIFSKLGLNYGKAVQFKQEFGTLMGVTTLYSTSRKRPLKPSMALMSSFDPEVRRVYLAK